MKSRKNKIPVILLSILLFLFALHAAQYQFHCIKLKPLDGYFLNAENTEFSWRDWFSGDYQEKEDKYLNDNFGFRSFFVKINYQWCFSLFNKAKIAWVIVGKENYLYEETYIKAWYGDDFIGQDSIEQRMYKLKMLQDTLNQLGKKIIVGLAPGKGAFYPEYIPDNYHKDRRITNIEVYRQYIEKWNIACLDFHRYFTDNKGKSFYPLYPQYGIHWSYYGMCLAADSIVRYIEKINNIRMPRIYWEKIKISQPEKDDNDIYKAMNLLFTLRTFDMAYPQIQFESDSGKIKPSLLVISDSFYWGIYNMGWGNLFTDNHFWFYNKEIYPENFASQHTTENIDLQKEIFKYDIIIILSTDANLPNLGWGFIEEMYNVFFDF